MHSKLTKLRIGNPKYMDLFRINHHGENIKKTYKITFI